MITDIKPAPSYKELADAFIELADGLSSADIIHMTGIPNNKADFIIDVFYRLIENLETGNENLCSSKNPVG